MNKLLLALLVVPTWTLSGCSEQQFVKGLNNTWSTGAGNAAGEPVFSSEAEKKKQAQAGKTSEK